MLNVDINLLRTFLEISKTRHFGKAAENLYLTQAAISARVKLLEETLGVALFERYRNNIQLTKQGQKLLVSAQEMVELWVRTTQEIRVPHNYQEISIAAPESVWQSKLQNLPNKLFKSNNQLQLTTESLNSSVILTRLLERTIDIGFLFDKPKIDELTISSTFHLSLALYSNKSETKLADINQTNFVSIDLGLSFKLIQSKLLANISSPIFQASNWQMAMDYATAFDGVALLPKSLASRQKKLYCLIDSPQIDREIYICSAKETLANPDKKDHTNLILKQIAKMYC